MPGLIKIRPTKIELIKLKRRFTLAKRVQKIVKDRLSIITLEFLQVARETVVAKQKLLDDFPDFYQSLSITAGYHGYIALEKEMIASERELDINIGSRNVAGVRLPSFEVPEVKRTSRGYALTDTSSLLDRTSQLAENCLENIIMLAELQSNLELLGQEINRTKRIVNALEYLIIPSLENTIRYLNMKFEERDREEKSRLKRVKVLLEQK
ncbi:V-type ATP synthase subunit D [Chloroflexota bacterium]